MAKTRGIRVIWTTYGTWLPGDPRGHWSPLFDFYGRLRKDGRQLNRADETTYRRSKFLMKEAPKKLSDDEIQIVARVIGDLCDHIAPGMPGAKYMLGAMWTIFAAAIEPTHVHLLFGPLKDDIGEVVGRIKSRTSSVLLKHSPNQGRSRIWTSGYWKVFLFDDHAVSAVKRYIEEHNRQVNRPARPWDWIQDYYLASSHSRPHAAG